MRFPLISVRAIMVSAEMYISFQNFGNNVTAKPAISWSVTPFPWETANKGEGGGIRMNNTVKVKTNFQRLRI